MQNYLYKLLWRSDRPSVHCRPSTFLNDLFQYLNLTLVASIYLLFITSYISSANRSFFNQNEVINYSGDLMTPPDQPKKSGKTNFIGKKKVKGRGRKNDDDDSSDENDW